MWSNWSYWNWCPCKFLQQDENGVSWPLCQHWEWEMKEWIKLLALGRPVPQTGSEKSSFRILPLDPWAEGLCRCELQACRHPQGPERTWAANRKQAWALREWAFPQDPGIREGLLLSQRQRASHGDRKKFRPCDWVWVWVGPVPEGRFQAWQGKRDTGELLGVAWYDMPSSH